MKCFSCNTEMHYLGEGGGIIDGIEVIGHEEICPNCESDVQIIYKIVVDKEVLHKIIWRSFECFYKELNKDENN